VSLLRSIDALIASAPPNPALGRSQSQADAPATQAVAIWHPTALLLAASAADSGGGCGSGQADSSLQQLSRFLNHKAPIPTQSLSGGRVGRPDVPAHGAAPRAGSLKRSRSPSAFQPYPATSPTEAGSLLGPAQCLPADPGMRSDASGETLLLAGSASLEARMSACTEPEAHGRCATCLPACPACLPACLPAPICTVLSCALCAAAGLAAAALVLSLCQHSRALRLAAPTQRPAPPLTGPSSCPPAPAVLAAYLMLTCSWLGWNLCKQACQRQMCASCTVLVPSSPVFPPGRRVRRCTADATPCRLAATAGILFLSLCTRGRCDAAWHQHSPAHAPAWPALSLSGKGWQVLLVAHPVSSGSLLDTTLNATFPQPAHKPFLCFPACSFWPP
jgi:hypothetical protein